MARILRPPCLNYNTFFHPNLCHVCKLEGQNILEPCPHCHMIYYCSEAHRLLHREDHKVMCEAIQSISNERNIRNTRNMKLNTWEIFKMANISYVKKILNRRLQKYELEMLMYAKSCFICFQQYNVTLHCPICKSVNLCCDHEVIRPEHSCQKLKLSLDINKYLANKQTEDLTLPRHILHLEIIETLSMTLFNQLYFKGINTDPCRPFQSYIYSEYLTQPLTMYFGIQCTSLVYSLQSHCPFVIHVIHGFLSDTNYLTAWEVILHVFHRITSLLIVIINPGLTEHPPFVPLCEKCVLDNKSLQYIYISNSYGDYANSPTYIRPNVIAGYHIKFLKIQLLFNLKAIERACCPLILTSYSYDEIRYNVNEIPLIPIYFQTNNFASCTPVRSIEDGSVCYNNKYLVIYKNRHSHPTDKAGSSFGA